MWKAKGKPPHYLIPRKIIMAENNHTMALSLRQTLNGQRVLRISGSAMRIATWNVRSLFGDEKLDNAELEMEQQQLDILGVSELRWIGTGEITTEKHVVYYSGSSTPERRNGVAIIIKKSLKPFVRSFIPLSDRVMLLQLQGQPFNVNIIQVYAPTSEKSDTEIENFYAHINTALRNVKKHEINITMGDFNAKVGHGKVDSIVGDFGLGSRNDRGDRLVQFCQEENFVITNTFYKLPPRRLYTWKSPADKPDKIVRNQIDFVLINRRHRNNIKSVKTYPGADIGSDHNPLIATLCVKLKKIHKPKETVRIDVTQLKDPNTRCKLHLAANNEIVRLKTMDKEMLNVEKTWRDLKTAFVHIGRNMLKPSPFKLNKCWITPAILGMILERRKFKGRNDEQYKKLQKIIKKAMIDAEEKWLLSECQELERFDAKHDSFNVHRKIKQLLGNKHNVKAHSILLDNMGNFANFANTLSEKLQIWEVYIKDLFSDQRKNNIDFAHTDTGPQITKSEVCFAIRQSKRGKALGSDLIPVDILKEIEECNLNYLVDFFNLIYTTGIIPQDWLKSTFVTLPKTSNPNRCSDYRTISLMSHVLKVFLKIIHGRIYSKCESVISNTQFGFRSGFGTRDALFAYQVLVQRCWDVNRDLFVCFIDYEKAFDRVRHEKLITLLGSVGVDSRDLNIIKNLYWQQEANVKVEGQVSSYIEIVRGVRQGCILSPLLFNIYAESIFTVALNDINEGIIVNGRLINNLRYADDTVLIADTLSGLQALVNAVQTKSTEYGININCKKTKYMIISRAPEPTSFFVINNTNIDRVSQYKYLGTIVNDRVDYSIEIKCRIEQARAAFRKMEKILCDRNLNLSLRIRVARCYVFSVLLYGVETWTLTETLCKKLEAFEMWVYRRMLRISWVQRVKNMTVLQRLSKDLEIMKTIKVRKLEYFGHIMRNTKYDLLQLIIQGKIAGKRPPGRRRTSWLKNLRQWYGQSTRSLFRTAASKVKIALMVANLR